MQIKADAHCQYRAVFRPEVGDDDSVLYSGDWQPLRASEELPLPFRENYIVVQCDGVEELHYHFNGSYSAGQSPGHGFPQQSKVLSPESSQNGNPGTTEQQQQQQQPKQQPKAGNVLDRPPSVIFLVIESLSRLNYLRYLPRTRRLLEERLGNTFYLEGLNKMADNSFPNMVPLLTGRRLYKAELSGDENYGPYDGWPFIWRNFSSLQPPLGYLTALLEDFPQFTLFNYHSKGFRQGQPTDFYPRPFWQHLFSEVPSLMLKVFPFNISPCWRDRTPKVDVFLRQLEAMMRAAERAARPLFAFAFYIELTHNNFNKAQTIDAHIARFIERSLGQLNDSVFVVMGDHGNRFGSVLQTTIGRIEERMPLFAVHLPPRLTARYPHLGANLATNRRRLSTWLDVHQMLSDIVQGNYTNKVGSSESESSSSSSSSSSGPMKRAYSPWREEIPVERSCAQALIDDLYCACDRRLTLDAKKSPLAVNSSAALLATLNRMLERGLVDGCSRLKLKAILRAELIFPSDSTAQARGFAQRIELTVAVSPSGAIFRARLRRSYRQQDWSVDGGQVTRLDEYGDQPWCLSQRDLKPFCFCSSPRPAHSLANLTKNLAVEGHHHFRALQSTSTSTTTTVSSV